jgi:hypothetical protein
MTLGQDADNDFHGRVSGKPADRLFGDRNVGRLAQGLALGNFKPGRNGVEPDDLRLGKNRQAIAAIAIDPLDGVNFLAGSFH